jgi:hypothetical protein
VPVRRGELERLPDAELAGLLAEAYRVIAEQAVGGGAGAAGGQGLAKLLEAAVVGQPIPEGAAGPVAAGAGEAAPGEAAL